MAGAGEQATARAPDTSGFMSGRRVLGVEVERRGGKWPCWYYTLQLHSPRSFRGGSPAAWYDDRTVSAANFFK